MNETQEIIGELHNEDFNNNEQSLGTIVDDLQKQCDEYKDKWMRSVAEVSNIRKRTLKEKEDLMKNANASFVKGILPVMDDFERAIINNEMTDDINTIKDAFKLIYRKMVSSMASIGVQQISSVGETFDTDYHEAIAMTPTNDEQKGKVVDCTLNGYTLNGNVVRHAKVVVGQ